MKKIKVLILCICTVFLLVFLTACQPGGAKANEPWVQTNAASGLQSINAAGTASTKAADGCCK